MYKLETRVSARRPRGTSKWRHNPNKISQTMLMDLVEHQNDVTTQKNFTNDVNGLVEHQNHVTTQKNFTNDVMVKTSSVNNPNVFDFKKGEEKKESS